MKVFISTSTFAEYDKSPLESLKKTGIEYDLNPHGRRLNEDEILDILTKDSYAGLVAGTEPLSAKVLQSAGSLRVISRVGVGLDNVDCGAAKDRNILVYNTPGSLTDSVAELTLGLILSCLRKISLMDRQLHNGVWKKKMGVLLKEKTLGIIGFGSIGRRVAELAGAFGVKVIFYDVIKKEDKAAQCVSLEELCAAADIISLHHSGAEPILSEELFRKMKEGVVLINTSRGTAYDESVLYNALLNGKVSAAALDVYAREPCAGKLLELDQVVATPHIGSYAKEARIEMEKQAVKNMIQGLKGVRP